jgi:hypothetical protein
MFGDGRMCCVEARFELLLLIADSGSSSRASNVVDIFNGSSGLWSTAVLSQSHDIAGRYDLSATSLPNQGLAFFAGGVGGL